MILRSCHCGGLDKSQELSVSFRAFPFVTRLDMEQRPPDPPSGSKLMASICSCPAGQAGVSAPPLTFAQPQQGKG